jgi:YaaC-like protein
VDREYRRFSAFIRQAENYYRSAKALPYRSSALLYYYSFMNLAKAALAVRAMQFNEHHGLTPRYGTPSTDLAQMQVHVRPRQGIFHALYDLLFATAIPNVAFDLLNLLGYVSETHVEYIEATGQQPRTSRTPKLRLVNDRNASWLLLGIENSFPIVRHAPAVQQAFNAVFQRVSVSPQQIRGVFDILMPSAADPIHSAATRDHHHSTTTCRFTKLRTSNLCNPARIRIFPTHPLSSQHGIVGDE